VGGDPALGRPILGLADLTELREDLLHPIGVERRRHGYIVADKPR
jgi:hypothetical protein